MKRKASVRHPLRQKLILISAVILIPMFCLSVYQTLQLKRCTEAYDESIRNITAANDYNLNFKDELDESMYKLVVSSLTFDTIDQSEDLTDPYQLIAHAREGFGGLYDQAAEGESKTWLTRLLKSLDLLEKHVDTIRDSLQEGGNYEENLYLLESNIYILTDLIQEEIQYYIYYEAANMESVRQMLSRQAALAMTVGVLALAGLSIFAVILNFFITKSVASSVHQLCGVADRIARGDFSARASCATQDEVALLADRFNHMAGELETLVDRIAREQQKLKNMELRLLQAQINPHFLYNTLDTIVWLVEGKKYQEAMDMVVSLSEFFRILLSKGHDFISVEEEERHIRSYLEIQQFRYRNILNYEISMEPELAHCRVLKLTLQPLVENALYHGIKRKRGMGNIWVKGWKKGDRICFEVRDDGVGMTEEELNRVRGGIYRADAEPENGFGIVNVFERIRLNYGADYGLWIDSVKGEGTQVRIEIPEEPIQQAELL